MSASNCTRCSNNLFLNGNTCVNNASQCTLNKVGRLTTILNSNYFININF